MMYIIKFILSVINTVVCKYYVCTALLVLFSLVTSVTDKNVFLNCFRRFRADLDKHCAVIAQELLKIENDNDLPQGLVNSLENWHTVAVDYIVRCKQGVGNNLKYLIHAVNSTCV